MQMNKIIISVITLKTKTFLWIHVDLARKNIDLFFANNHLMSWKDIESWFEAF